MDQLSAQPPLFCESPEEAFRATILAIGGIKAIACELRSTKTQTEAVNWLNQALDPSRPEKLSLGDIAWIFREARKKGIHTAIGYFLADADYAPPTPIDPESRRERLELEILNMGKTLTSALAQLEELRTRRS